MQAASLRRPRTLAVAGAIAWLILTVVGVLPSQDGPSGRLAHDICASLATVFFALAVGGGLLEWWQSREWKRRTQWVLPDLLDRATRETGLVASRATAAVERSPGDRQQDSGFIANAFELPWTPTSDQVVKYVDERRGRSLLDLLPDPTARTVSEAGASLAEQHDVNRMGIEEHADKLWALSLELASYLDDRRAPALLTRSAALHDAVRDFVDPLPGRTVPAASWPALAGLNLGKILKSAADVGRALSDAYDEAGRRASDDSLKKRFKTQRSERANADKERAEMIKFLIAAEEQERDLAAGADFAVREKRLQDRVAAIKASPDRKEGSDRQLEKALEDFSTSDREDEDGNA